MKENNQYPECIKVAKRVLCRQKQSNSAVGKTRRISTGKGVLT